MLEILIKFLGLEKIDRQFVKKIPYHLCLFIGFSFLVTYIDYTWEWMYVQYLFVISLVLFLSLNSIFNHVINNYIRNYMEYAKFEKFISQLTGILDGSFSLISEGFDKKRVRNLFGLMIVSGLFLLIFDLSMFALIFQYLQIQFSIRLVLFGILLFYIYNDVLKLDYIDKYEVTKGKYSFEVNILERFSVTNVMEGKPYSKYIRLPVFFCLRLFSPLASLDIEFPLVRQYLVYRTEEIEDIIKEYMNKKEGVALQEFKVKNNRSYSLNTILQNKKPVKLTTILNQSPKKSFPYLYDPKYYSKKGRDPKIKYTVLKIIKKPKITQNLTDEEIKRKTVTLGYMFLQLFHGAYIKTNYSKKYDVGSKRNRGLEYESIFRTEVSRKEILFILMVGQRDHVKGIEIKLKMASQDVPKRALGIDMVDED